jgi:WD40 repeat protein
VAATPDGKCFAHDEIIPNATGNVAEDPKGFLVRVRETATGQVTDTIGEFASPLCNLAFSPDGALLAISTEDNGMSLYDCQLHRYKHATLPGTTLDWYTDAVFSPDGRRLAALSREALCIWDVETGQKVITLIGAPPRPSDNGYNPHIAWSQDGHRLAAGTWDQNVSIWDSADMQAPLAKQRLYQVAEERGRNQQAARGAAGK